MVTALAEDKQKEEVVHNVKDEMSLPKKWKICFIFSFWEAGKVVEEGLTRWGGG